MHCLADAVLLGITLWVYILKVLKRDFSLTGTFLYTDMSPGDISVSNVTEGERERDREG